MHFLSLMLLILMGSTVIKLVITFWCAVLIFLKRMTEDDMESQAGSTLGTLEMVQAVSGTLAFCAYVVSSPVSS